MTIKHPFDPQISDAIRAIKSDAVFSTIADGSIVWHDSNPTNITQEQIDTKLAELKTEYAAQDYARKREEAYPATKDFMEAYTEKEIGGDSTKWDAYVINYNKVRTENPK